MNFARLRPHWPLLIVLAGAAVLIFARLGQDYLWSDEGDTAVLASNVLSHGVPSAWDGVTFIDSDFGKRVNDDLVMVSHPWLQYYVTAASFALLGESPFAARVPFALFGLLTIGLTYGLVWQATRHRWTAAAAAVLLTASVQFLLYSRQSRYYTLSAALTCLLIWQFFRMKSRRSAAGFAVIGILLFHSHPAAIAPLGAMAILTLLPGKFREYRRWFWTAMPVIALFTVPWLFLASSGYAENADTLKRIEQLFPRIAQFAIECGSVTALPAVAIVLAVLTWTNRKVRRVETGDQRLMLLIAATLGAYAIVMALTQSRDTIWSIGLRYTPAVLPFGAILAALTIRRVAPSHRALAIGLVLLLAFTKIGRLTPWTFWHDSIAKRDPDALVSFHNPARATDRILRTGQIAFLQSLGRSNVGTTGRVVEYLRQNAKPGEVVLTNFGWESLYFHTRLPLGMTVLSSYPIYQSAKSHGLPDYVFRAADAKWIVWRRAWGAYRGQSIDQVLARFADERRPVTQVVTLPETLWENRENIHFRRFADGRYIYPWYDGVPETVIYRVGTPPSTPGKP